MACMKKDSQVVVRMPSELREKLKILAEIDSRTLAAYITLVLEQHVAKREKRQ